MSVSRAAQAIAWLGGGAFVASLAYFVRFYTSAIDAAVPAQGPGLLARSILIDTALFTIFALHHSVLARPAVKRSLVRVVPAPLERSLYVWVASALFFILCYFWQRVPADFSLVLTGPMLWLTRAMQVAGLVLIVSAVRSIDPLELAGIRQVRRAGPSGPTAGTISTAFPYNLVRHPIYLGWILTTFGASPLTADRLLFASLSAVYLVMAVPWEERSLIKLMGDEYARYQAQVRWRVVPGIY